jgi:hypothetical protein
MRTMSLRVASSLRQPLDVTSLAGERMKITPDIGVGMMHLSARAEDVDQLLHEVQRVAVAARGMRSRAALLEQTTGLAIPVENADLNQSWRAMKTAKTPRSRKRTGNSVLVSSNFHTLDESRPARLA